jgi:hypothetical protein
MIIPMRKKKTDRSSRNNNQQRNLRINWHYRQNGLNRHLQNIHPAAAQSRFFSAAHGIFIRF